jgi:hypothetical protein
MARHRLRTDSVDPCRLVRQVSEIMQLQPGNLIHPPDEPAGVLFTFSHGSSRTIFRSCRTSRQGPTSDCNPCRCVT